MTRTLHYKIEETDNGKTVSRFLQEQGFSHRVLVSLKKTPQSVVRDSDWLYLNEPLHTGDLLLVQLSETETSKNILPVKLPLSICYEDEDILVVDKPAGMPIHPSMNHYDNTLANAVAWYYKEKGIPYVFRCMNRLDRDTTGLTVLAKHALSSCILSSAIRDHNVHREYLAIVSGATDDHGTIDAPIARRDASILEREVNFTSGEHAVTHYRTLARQDGLSLLSLHLETGRTHQIRVHMNYIGHPLIGDFLYHPDFSKIKRQALHSSRLTFFHPVTKEPLCFTAPLPADMQCLFKDYRIPPLT